MVEPTDDFVNHSNRSSPFHSSTFLNSAGSVLMDLHELYHEYHKDSEPSVPLFMGVELQRERNPSRSAKSQFSRNVRFFDYDPREKRIPRSGRAAK